MGAVLGLVFLHYAWTASSAANPFAFGEKKNDYYNLLADGLLAGHLHLLVPPAPELSRLADAYDPRQNAPYRTNLDFSFYRGRYYLYFGIAPALTLFIPFRLITGIDVPEGFAATLFMFGAVCFSVAILVRLGRLYVPAPPLPLLLAAELFLALCGFAPFILRRPLVYEVAVSAGAFFLMGGLFWLLAGATAGPPRWTALTLGSLFLGLAAGSRPHHALAAPLLAGTWLWVTREATPARKRRAAACLGGPFALCGAGLLLYNHARFGSWLEFGQTYILDAHNHPHLKLLSPSYAPSHLFLILLAPPSFDLDFPFVHVYPAIWPALPHTRAVVEAIAGLLPCAPPAVLAFLAPALWARARRTAAAPLLPIAVAAVLLALALVLLAFLACYVGLSARYFADVAPPLLLAAALVWIHCDHRLRARRAWRISLHAVIGALALFGAMVHLAVGLTGYYDLFRKRNPPEYEAIEDRFRWLQRLLLRRSGGYGELTMRVRLPEPRPARSEALVSVDDGPRSHVLCLRYVDADTVVFRLHPPEGVPIRSRDIPIAAGETHDLQVSMGSLLPHLNPRALAVFFPGSADPGRWLSVRLDGRPVLEADVALDPEPPSAVRIGRSTSAVQACPADFSGSIEGTRRAWGGR